MKIGVYGLGRFGSLWAGMLARRHDVVACSRDPRRTPPLGVRAGDLAEVASAEAVFLCVAISAMEEACGVIRPHLGPGTVVMDTCSVKVSPARVMTAVFTEPTPILATHPMFGPDSIGGVDLPLVLCPVRSTPELTEGWSHRFRDLGLHVVVMSPEEHDREAAYTQGVTHLVGRVLADLGLKQSPIGTLGYKRLLGIVEQTCNDTWQLFLDLQGYNPYTPQMRLKLRESFERILGKLES